MSILMRGGDQKWNFDCHTHLTEWEMDCPRRRLGTSFMAVKAWTPLILFLFFSGVLLFTPGKCQAGENRAKMPRFLATNLWLQIMEI